MSALAVAVALFLAADEEAISSTDPEIAPLVQGWSVIGGRTLGTNANGIEGSLGWPGLSVAYSRGLMAHLDVGIRVSFNYGLEGLVSSVRPGAKIQGLVKYRFLASGPVSFGAAFEPGPLFSVDRFGNALIGFSLPLSLRLGVAVSSAVGLGFSFDVPLWVQFGPGGGVNLPLLPGLGLEYFIKSNLAAFFQVRMGPTLRPYSIVELSFDARVGVAYRF